MRIIEGSEDLEEGFRFYYVEPGVSDVAIHCGKGEGFDMGSFRFDDGLAIHAVIEIVGYLVVVKDGLITLNDGVVAGGDETFCPICEQHAAAFCVVLWRMEIDKAAGSRGITVAGLERGQVLDRVADADRACGRLCEAGN